MMDEKLSKCYNVPTMMDEKFPEYYNVTTMTDEKLPRYYNVTTMTDVSSNLEGHFEMWKCQKSISLVNKCNLTP